MGKITSRTLESTRCSWGTSSEGCDLIPDSGSVREGPDLGRLLPDINHPFQAYLCSVVNAWF